MEPVLPAVDPAIAEQLLHQLKGRNAERDAFVGITEDYMTLLNRNRVLEVRVAQLEKETAELQEENQTLATNYAVARESVAQGEEVKALEAKMQQLNLELTGVYRDKSKLAEDMLQVTGQLQIVRENNEMQAKQINQDSLKIQKLQTEVKELRSTAESERAACTLASEELQACRSRREELEKDVEAKEAQNNQLVERILAMKVEQVELLNMAVQEHDSAVRNAGHLRRTAEEVLQRQGSSSSQPGDVLAAGEGILRKGLTMMRKAGDRRNSSEEPMEDEHDEAISYFMGVESRRPTRVVSSIPTAHAGGCYTVAFCHSGTRLASAGADKCVRIWDPDSGTGLSRLEGMQGTVLEVDWTSDDKHLLAAGSDKVLRLWDSHTGRAKHVLTGHTDKVCTVKCSPADPHRAVSGSSDRSIKIWDLHRGHIAQTIICHSTVNSVCMSIDGQIVISGHFDGALRFWDLRGGSPINEVTGLHNQQIMSVNALHRSNTVLTNSRDNSIKLVNIATQEVIQTLPSAAGHLVCRATVSPDDRFIACGLTDSGVGVWDREAATMATTLRHSSGHQPNAQLLSTAWSPGGLQLASADRSGTIVVWS